MIKIKKIICLAILIQCVLLFFSCVDKNEWEVDKSHDRLFSISKMSVSAYKTEADFIWTVTPNAEYYIVEVSKDSLHDGIEMGVSNGVKVYGEDKLIVKSPYTLTSLESSTKYFLRAKAVSETKESKWAYLASVYFETKGEQIMLSVLPEERTDKSVILRWDAVGLPVSHIVLEYPEGEMLQKIRVDLTAENIENSSVFIDDLIESTTYVATIYNEENKRGEISFRTNESIPLGGVSRTLDGTEDIVQYLDTITASDVTLTLPQGSVYESMWINELSEPQTTLPIPDRITSLTIIGAEGEGEQAVINTTSIKLSPGLIKLRFRNIELRGKSNDSDYVVNESVTRPIENVSFDDCTINTFRGVFRMQNETNTSSLSKISFLNCIVHNIGGYGVVNGASKVLYGDINIENCTFYNLKEVFVVLRSKPSAINMSSCTFYNTIKDGKYYFDMKNSDVDCTPSVFRVEKCIFGKIYSGLARATNPGNKVNNFIFDSYATNDCLINSGYPLTGVDMYEGFSIDLFTDPDNANFSIKDPSFIGKNTAGDPRWR